MVGGRLSTKFMCKVSERSGEGGGRAMCNMLNGRGEVWVFQHAKDICAGRREGFVVDIMSAEDFRPGKRRVGASGLARISQREDCDRSSQHVQDEIGE